MSIPNFQKILLPLYKETNIDGEISMNDGEENKIVEVRCFKRRS